MPIRDFFSHAWQHSSAQKRLAAVRAITDPHLLERIACRGSHRDARLTAALRLTDEDRLIRAIEVAEDDDVRAAALSRLSNEGRAALVSMIRLPADVRRAAFESITLPSTMATVIDRLLALVFRLPSPATLERLIAIGWAPRNDDEAALAAVALSDWSALLDVARRSPGSVRRLIGWENSVRDRVADACLHVLAHEPPLTMEEGTLVLARALQDYEAEHWRAEVFDRERHRSDFAEPVRRASGASD